MRSRSAKLRERLARQKLASEASRARSSFPQAKGASALNEHKQLTMPFSQRKSASQIFATQIARCQTRNHAIGRKHAAKKAKNDRRPPNDDRRLDLDISLVDQRASLVAQQITEPDPVNRFALREQISLLDARKAEDDY